MKSAPSVSPSKKPEKNNYPEFQASYISCSAEEGKYEENLKSKFPKDANKTSRPQSGVAKNQNTYLSSSDLPDLNSEIIIKGFDSLKSSELVFGPAKDGGYYLIGMNKLHKFVFENKPWSESDLLIQTVAEIRLNNLNVSLLNELNDVDTIEDLKESTIAHLFSDFIKN